MTKTSTHIIKIIATALLLIGASQAYASCDVPSDRASDGSRCGGRAASERPGGK